MGECPKVMKSNAVVHTLAGRQVVGLVGLLFLLVAVLGLATVRAEGARSVSDEERSQKGYMGVKMQELDEDLVKGLNLKVKRGVLISEVIEGSPAQKAGLEDGDVIVSFNGKKITSSKVLGDLVATTEVGDEVRVKVLRDNKSKTLKVVVGEWPEEQAWAFAAPGDFKRFCVKAFRPQLGVRIHDMDEDLAPYFGVDDGEGVLVLGVVEDSAAEEAGMRAGDVIVEIDEREIKSTTDLYDAVGKIDAGEKFDVTVIREKKRLVLEGAIAESEGVFQFGHMFDKHHFNKAGQIWIPDMKDDIRKELDQLKEELEELRKELKETTKQRKST